jgi:hypothetical protein
MKNTTMETKTRSIELQGLFESLGFDVSLQSFSVLVHGEYKNGTNVHGIFRSPRGEGTESILLMAPQYIQNGTCKQGIECR